MDVVLLVGGEKRSVECVMDLLNFGEAELICDRKEDFNDHKGFFLFEGKFEIGNGAF